MELRKTSGLIACCSLLAMALLSGCGNSSNNNTIPSTTSIFNAHSILFKNNSTLRTTGYNGFGQLGLGSLTGVSVGTVVPGLGPVNGASAGGDHTLAFSFTNLSSVSAWGSNYHGQIGSAVPVTGTSAFSSTPQKVSLHGSPGGINGNPAGTVTSVSAGGLHSLAVMDGLVYSWGYDGFGQLGDRQGQTNLADNATPSQVVLKLTTGNAPLTNIFQVSAGGAFSLALTDLAHNGLVYAWGDNTFGQIGSDPNSPANLTPSDPRLVFGPPTTTSNGIVTPPTPLNNITQVVAGGAMSYALKNDGTLWAWGYNGMGQLGNPAVVVSVTAANLVPTQVAIPAGTVITKVAAGLSHAIALDLSGKVWAWGFNEFGQLGTSPSSTINSSTPAQVLGPNGIGTLLVNVIDIAAFGNASLALVRDPATGVETWYGWGDNGFGQLGNPVSNSSLSKLFIPTRVQTP